MVRLCHPSKMNDIGSNPISPDKYIIHSLIPNKLGNLNKSEEIKKWTEQYNICDLNNYYDYYLDVYSTHPIDKKVNKGLTVRQLKCYVSWVKNVAIQFGSYLIN